MLIKSIVYCGQTAIVACDERCEKAWGHSSRPKVQMSGNEDDYAYLADGELGIAPEDPGTYEGDHAKPRTPEQRMNKWCVRECERCAITSPDHPDDIPVTLDFTKRVFNIPQEQNK